MFLIALQAGEFAALALGIFGVAGVVFTALKFNRSDTSEIVQQSSSIVGEMKVLNDELRTATESLRSENRTLRGEIDRLTEQVKRLTQQLRGTIGRHGD